jgi:Polyketide cyclase / dehydrase and lipid transport
MKPVTICVEIACPPATAWAYLADAERNVQWLDNMESCRWITEPPIAVGSRYEQVARFLGKHVRATFEVTELRDGAFITISSLPGSSFPLAITRRLDLLDAGRCRVTETAAGDPHGFYRLAEPLMRALVRRNIARAYAKLKRLLETKPARRVALCCDTDYLLPR